jgi:tetratricopeptide (TPR) repeat protein
MFSIPGVVWLWRRTTSIGPAFRRASMPALSPVSRMTLAIAVLFVAGAVLNVETGWDALMYHLRLPSFYVYRHKFYDVWHSYYSAYPAQVEMLYTLSMLVRDDLLARLLNVALGAGLLGATVAVSGELGMTGGGVLLLAASPMFLMLMTRAYVDLGVALLVTLSLLNFLRWHRTGSSRFLIACGLLAGFGMGAKYAGVFMVAAVLAGMGARLGKTGGRRAAVGWGLAAALPVAPWLLKNWLMKGNPVAPFLGVLFGNSDPLPADVQTVFGGAAPARSLLVSLPFRIESLILGQGNLESPVLPVFAGLAPLLACRGLPPAASVLARAVGAYALACLVLAPETRFFLPALPALGVLIAGAVGAASSREKRARFALRGLLEISVIAGTLYFPALLWLQADPFTLVTGRDSVETRLMRGLPPVPYASYASRALKELVPASGRVLVMCNFTTYYYERECLAEFHYGQSRLTRFIREGGDAGGIALVLKRRGVEWLLASGSTVHQYLRIPGYFDVPPPGWEEFKRFLAERTDVVWQTDNYVLFRVVRRHRARPLPVLPVRETIGFDDGDRALAEGRCREALAVFLSPPPVLADVGSTYLRQGDAFNATGDYRRAERAFRRALALGADVPRVRLGLAHALLNQNRPAEGLPHAREAWRQDPQSSYAAATLATIYASLRWPDMARDMILKAVRLRPDSAMFRALARQFGAE